MSIRKIRFRIVDAKRRVIERALIFIAWHLPKPLVYWASIRLMAHATTGPYSSQVVPELTAMDALKRWTP